MTNEEFEKILEGRLEATKKVLGVKASEYARGSDRLHNFKRVAEVKRITPAEACIDGFCKHLVSILDMVDDHSKGVSNVISIWEEKIGDAINYLILLEALVKECTKETNIKGDTLEDAKQGMEGL